jgi:hypothetical protein
MVPGLDEAFFHRVVGLAMPVPVLATAPAPRKEVLWVIANLAASAMVRCASCNPAPGTPSLPHPLPPTHTRPRFSARHCLLRDRVVLTCTTAHCAV